MVEANNDVAWEDRDALFEEEEPLEESEDQGLSVVDFDGLVLAPSDWTVGTVYEQIGKQIDLDPEFQRRNVWSSTAKSRFIESIFLGVPIPQILLSSKKDARSSYIVLDGKQRLTTIREFFDGHFSNGRKFKLRNLTVLSKDLNGLTWDKIRELDEWRDRFQNATIRTAVLRGWKSEAVLYEIFYRLNSGSVRLSPMELRMSLHPGPFLKYIIKWTEDIGPLHHLLRKAEPDPRMSDVELCIRFLGFSSKEVSYRGDLKKFLDQVSERFNEGFEDDAVRGNIERSLISLNEAIDAGLLIFGEAGFCRKWLGDRFERRFNRAIFDVLAGSLSDPRFRDWARRHSDSVVDAYKALCVNDTEFVRAVETTTKTADATRKRYEAWYSEVRRISQIEIPIPLID